MNDKDIKWSILYGFCINLETEIVGVIIWNGVYNQNKDNKGLRLKSADKLITLIILFKQPNLIIKRHSI